MIKFQQRACFMVNFRTPLHAPILAPWRKLSFLLFWADRLLGYSGIWKQTKQTSASPGNQQHISAQRNVRGCPTEFPAHVSTDGPRSCGTLHMTAQTGSPIETLQAWGAKTRWTSCNIFNMQNHAAAASQSGHRTGLPFGGDIGGIFLVRSPGKLEGF